MNRGSSLARGRLQGGVSTFNEAPIHESGKYRLPAGRRLHLGPFNEAPIHESGK